MQIREIRAHRFLLCGLCVSAVSLYSTPFPVTIPSMDPSHPDTAAMLKEARAKAEHLLSELLKQQAEVEANPPDLPPEKLAQGRFAMQKAIESAQRASRVWTMPSASPPST